nr:hypothetical protein [Xanthomonas maliensis]
MDPAIVRYRGAPRHQVWRRGEAWTAVADGIDVDAALVPRGWAVRHRRWTLLLVGVALLGLALAAAWRHGTPAWVWAVLLVGELLLRGWAAGSAAVWRNRALQRAGWEPVVRLHAISCRDAVTTAQIRQCGLRR